MGSSGNKGFTLIEVLLSSVILAVGIVFVLQAFSFCARSAALSEDIIRASFIAKDALSDLEFQPAGPNEKEGTDGKFSWKYTLTQVKDQPLSQCDYSIRWQRSNREESMNVSTYLQQ